MRTILAAAALWALALACAGAPRPYNAPQPRAAGCPIDVVRDGAPPRPVRRVGEVVVRCRGDAANDEPRCMRMLQDQACQLGAEVIWDLGSSEIEDGRQMRAVAGVYRPQS